ncbi:adenylosuccinate lyase [Rubeoparvulum massiliense]|uniref:adenylosuccinate lyase n=1 Tax=Rubeoparvulum massiliense TaxID=1631346 RepID=UPI00065DD4D0|nr:adenylosuccinate lyase [Rubeoparvulum massiliense]
MFQPISPLDGRYAEQLAAVGDTFSEWALMKHRVQVEVEWLIYLSRHEGIEQVRALSQDEESFLRALVTEFDDAMYERIKEIEETTRHDMKAVEYFIKEQMKATTLLDMNEFVHFACTSEDINNLAYALMLKEGVARVWLPQAIRLETAVAQLAEEYKDIPMLARTHGQPATPTTLGKELAIFVYRWQRQRRYVEAQEYLGKLNGATGNYNAHVVAYPEVDWEQAGQQFVEHLGLTYNPLTTQIESHDYVAELFHTMARYNQILLDFNRDIWTYISMNYLKLKVVAGQVGSSTMPHKVNPINFENSEANVGISNALLLHLAEKLPVSRMQRDLSDSSALRNMGVAIGHSYLAMQSAIRGVQDLSANEEQLLQDLDHNWEVLAEPIQTVMRKHGLPNPYEQLKALTRGQRVTQEMLKQFIRELPLPVEEIQRLLQLTPAKYIGVAPQLVRHIQKSMLK